MKPSLQLKISQHLALTPRLQQSIRLLQLSTVELEQELEKYLLENPLLERGDEVFVPEDSRHAGNAGEEEKPSVEEVEIPSPSSEEEGWQGETEVSYANAPGSFNDDDDDYRDVRATTTTLREHLSRQLGLTKLPSRDRGLVQYLIEALNENGYLTQSLEDLADLLPPGLEIDIDELRIALCHLQNFDPTGVGARNAQECLLLQLKALPRNYVQIVALRIVSGYLDLLAMRDFTRLKKYVECNDECLSEAQDLIRSLDPKPGAKFAAPDTLYVVPDVVVRKVRGQWTASINADACPRLRINDLYARILARQRGSTLASHLQEARWLVRNVQQRFDTILRVSQAIIDRQRPFFDHGDVAMRPLVMREISEALGMHESTVSRVTTQKYMATPRGIYELKYFFGSHIVTEAGDACSATAIRALIKQLIGAENAKKPITDGAIAELLGQQGISVARRTVAKYRDLLGIPTVKLRKTI